MSVKSTVASTRSGSGDSRTPVEELADLREDLVTAAASPRGCGGCRAARRTARSGMFAARKRAFSTWQIGSSTLVHDQRRHRAPTAPHVAYVDVQCHREEGDRVARASSRRSEGLPNQRCVPSGSGSSGKEAGSAVNARPQSPGSSRIQASNSSRRLAPGPVVGLSPPSPPHRSAAAPRCARGTSLQTASRAARPPDTPTSAARCGADRVHHARARRPSAPPACRPASLPERPIPRLSKRDQPRERGQLLAEVPVAAGAPRGRRRCDRARDPDQVDRAVAEHLVRDLHFAARGVATSGASLTAGELPRAAELEPLAVLVVPAAADLDEAEPPHEPQRGLCSRPDRGDKAVDPWARAQSSSACTASPAKPCRRCSAKIV